MSGKPITTDLEPAAAPDSAATAGILADLRSGEGGASAEAGPALGDLSGAKSKRRISLQTIVVVGVLALSSTSLYFMRKRGMNVGLHDFKNMPSISGEIDKIRTTNTAAERSILAELFKASLPQTQEGTALQKNPFVLEERKGEVVSNGPASRDPGADRLMQIKERFKTIRLMSVMQGPTPLARINDRLVRVGDIVEEYFLVAQIHDRSADLIADGRTYSLNMSDAAPGGQKPPSRPGGTVPPRR